MSDNDKKGFFSRLFGGKKAAVEAEKQTEAPEQQVTDPAKMPLPDADKPAAHAVDVAPAVAAPSDVSPALEERVATSNASAVADVAPAPLPAVVMPPTPAPALASTLAPASKADTPAQAVISIAHPVSAPAVLSTLAPEPLPAKQSWWQRLKGGLARTSSSIGTGISDLFVKRKLDTAALEDLEDILIQADLGVDTTDRIIKAVRSGRYDKEISADEVKQILATEVEATLKPVALPLVIDASRKPFVLLMIGVNGAGKTTTIGKLAQKFRAEGRSVMLAAGDTFRAAAIEQLKVWGERTGAHVIARPQGSDAAGLAFDALKEARERGVDVLMIDTAGRLQNKAGLMAELEKIVRVVKKFDPDAPHAALLVLDATTGQNAVSQVEIFAKTAGVTGLVMTKLDGTARGGILVSIAAKSGLPVHFIGVGENVDDLEPFAARDFARAIAGLPE